MNEVTIMNEIKGKYVLETDLSPKMCTGISFAVNNTNEELILLLLRIEKHSNLFR